MPALPDAPRIPYDRIVGATLVGYADDGSGLDELTNHRADAIDNMVDEDDDYYYAVGGPGQDGWLAAKLPTFDLAGFLFVCSNNDDNRTPQYSTDSTDGADGTWTNIPGWASATSTGVQAAYRNDLTIVDPVITGVTAVRWGATVDGVADQEYRAVHIYGYLQTADRLELWHPTLDQRLDGDAFDVDPLARLSTVDVDFRVKNLSSTKQADSVSLEAYIDSDTTPSVLGWHSLSDGGAFGAGPLALGNLAAGAISSVLTLRREPPSDATLGYWTTKLFADASSWT